MAPFLRYETMDGIKFHDLSLKETTVLGREKGCDIVVTDNNASRKHCEVHGLGGGYVIKDLHSKNGTCVNGAPVSSWTLKDGDLISIGSSVFKYILHK